MGRPRSFDKVTDWIYVETDPSISFFKAEGGTGDDWDRSRTTINFARFRIFAGAKGAFQDRLGDVENGEDLSAFSGPSEFFAATSSAERPFICIVDRVKPEIERTNVIRQTQVWQMVEPTEVFVILPPFAV